MLKNADVTIYECGTYARHFVPDVYWFDCRGRTITTRGCTITDSILVYLYTFDYIPKAGDILVVGNCDYVFDASTERAASDSMKAFRAAHPDFAVAKAVSDCRYGGLRHIEVMAR